MENSIELRKRKNDVMFRDLEGIQFEILLAATSGIRDRKERNEKMKELADGWKYGMERIVRKIVKDAIDSGNVRAEEFLWSLVIWFYYLAVMQVAANFDQCN